MSRTKTTGNPNAKTLTVHGLALYISEKNGISVSEATDSILMVFDAVQQIIIAGDRVRLPRFGAFYLQRHKGHFMQFGAQTTRMPDYYVAKFAASASLNKHIRDVVPPDAFDVPGENAENQAAGAAEA